MDQDTQSQLDRATELLKELEDTCNTDLQVENVSRRIKILSQEVLIKIKYLFDQSIYKFFEKHYLQNLTARDQQSAKVYFPIVLKTQDLDSVLGRGKMSNLKEKYPLFYHFLSSVQPYNSDYAWLGHLAKYASEKHIRLTPQKRTESKRVIISRYGGSVSWGPGVTFGNGVSVVGVPIDPQTQMPVPNSVAETKIERWVSFSFDDSDINVLWLCKKSVEDGEKIIQKVFEFV